MEDIYSICCKAVLLFLKNRNSKAIRLSCYIYITKHYRYCVSLGCVLKATPCISYDVKFCKMSRNKKRAWILTAQLVRSATDNINKRPQKRRLRTNCRQMFQLLLQHARWPTVQPWLDGGTFEQLRNLTEITIPVNDFRDSMDGFIGFIEDRDSSDGYRSQKNNTSCCD
jgi:hypothetical protein